MKMALSLIKTRTLFKTLNPRTISTFPYLSQEPQLAEPHILDSPSPLPPNPSTGSPIYSDNWRKSPLSPPDGQSLVPLGFSRQTSRLQAFARSLDLGSVLDVFADYMTSQRWNDIKDLFEVWIRCLDSNGKPNKPDVNLFNHYLRANLMSGVSAGDLLDLVAQMEDYQLTPNTASFNLVLKSMALGKESVAAEKLLERGIGRLLWRCLVHAVWWNVWAERNRRIFEGQERTWDQVRNDVISSIRSWYRFEAATKGVSRDQLVCNWDCFL